MAHASHTEHHLSASAPWLHSISIRLPAPSFHLCPAIRQPGGRGPASSTSPSPTGRLGSQGAVCCLVLNSRGMLHVGILWLPLAEKTTAPIHFLGSSQRCKGSCNRLLLQAQGCTQLYLPKMVRWAQGHLCKDRFQKAVVAGGNIIANTAMQGQRKMSEKQRAADRNHSARATSLPCC